MKKKIMVYFVMILMMTIIIPTTESCNWNSDMFDVLDQQSLKDDDSKTISLFHLAQSFIPTYPTLTKVMLLLSKSSSDAMYESYNVEIRKDTLTSQTQTQSNLDQSYIDTGKNWIEFDFPDIDVDIGSTYYIIIHGETMTGDTGSVSWHFGYPDPYTNGAAYRNSPGGWFEYNDTIEVDFCFKTFGIPDNNPPSKPEKPDGPASGKAGISYQYSSSSFDLDGNQVQLLFDWGDGTDSGWLDPVNSGETVTVSNSWSAEGTYQIKVRAKDVPSSTMSPWSDSLSVNMPRTKNKQVNFGTIFVMGLSVDVKIIQLEPGEDHVDLEVLNQPLKIWINGLLQAPITINSGAFVRLYKARGIFHPMLPFCFGICNNYGIIG